MQNKRFLWIGLGVLALVLVGGTAFFLLNPSATVEAQDDTAEVQTSTVRRGDITISATGAGTVIAATEISLAFDSTGTLEALYVTVGDDVVEGDLLAELDATAAEQALANAELAYAQSVMQVDGSATEAGISYNDISLEEARLTLETAQEAYDDLVNWEPDEDEIALAEANLASAEAAYNAARGSEYASSTNIEIQQISLDQAQRSLEEAQDAYDTAYDVGREWELGDPRRADALLAERDAADANLLRAQEALRVAELNYNSTVSSTNISSSTSAQTNLLNAQIELAAAQDGPTDEEIAAAEATLEQAELAYQQALLNAEAQKLSLQQAEIDLATAEQALAGTQLTAPIDGTIMTIDANVGEQVSTTFMTLADLTQPMVEIYLDETDLDKVGVGFEVDVAFDALPDDTFTGTIVQVDPQLTAENGVTAVRAVVQLNADSFAKPQTLPVGMNATVDVIGGRTEDALLVPVEAVRELDSGQTAVFVMVDGEPELRFVEVGLQDFTYAEILDGLEEGDVVTTGIVQTQ